MGETKQYNENELYEMYDYLLQKEQELEAAMLKASRKALTLTVKRNSLNC